MVDIQIQVVLPIAYRPYMVVGLFAVQFDRFVRMEQDGRSAILLIIEFLLITAHPQRKIRIAALRLGYSFRQNGAVDLICQPQLHPDGVIHLQAKAAHCVHNISGSD